MEWQRGRAWPGFVCSSSFLSAATIWNRDFFPYLLSITRQARDRLSIFTTDRPSLKENRNDQDGDDVHDFDHRIDRGPAVSL